MQPKRKFSPCGGKERGEGAVNTGRPAGDKGTAIPVFLRAEEQCNSCFPGGENRGKRVIAAKKQI